MTIKIVNLALLNFRKAKKFELRLDGKSATVKGDNATGKTTLSDAWLWLLTGKDSSGQADFEIKTTDSYGEPLHNLDHSVRAELLVDGQPLTLTRTMREKWVKKRGSVTQDFSGHETTYEVDGVPVGERAFNDKIASLVPADLLPALSSPAYFPSKMPWKDRRVLLLKMCGDLSTEQVLASSPELMPLRAALNGKTVEDFKAICQASQKRINGDLIQLPGRIDEASRSSEYTEDVAALEDAISAANEALRTAQQAEADAKAGGGASTLRIKLNEAEAAVQRYGMGRQARVAELTAGYRQNKSNADQDVQGAEASVRRYDRELVTLRAGLARSEQSLQAKRTEWETVSASEMPASEDKVCPTCGQKLSAARTKAANEKAEADFNAKKAEHLTAIMADADVIKRGKERFEADIATAQAQLDGWNRELADAKADAAQAAIALTDREQAAPQDDGTELEALQLEVTVLKEQLDDADAINAETIAEAQSLTAEVQSGLSTLMTRKAAVDAAVQAKARVKELEAKQKELSAEYERVQGLVFLCDKFTTTKVACLESRINERFRHARFKLFSRLVNGGIEERCDVTFQGVPFGKGMSTAECVNAGVDIIRTMAEHYQVSLPLFVDNQESVSQLIDCGDIQVVKLIVVPGQKQLKVEVGA